MPERTEYRVVEVDGDFAIKGFGQIETAEEEWAYLERVYGRVDGARHRIQKRTVIETPWEDVEQGEEDRDG